MTSYMMVKWRDACLSEAGLRLSSPSPFIHYVQGIEARN